MYTCSKQPNLPSVRAAVPSGSLSEPTISTSQHIKQELNNEMDLQAEEVSVLEAETTVQSTDSYWR